MQDRAGRGGDGMSEGGSQARVFTVDEARTALLDLLPTIAEFIRLRADAAELRVSADRASLIGDDLEALNQKLETLMGTIAASGAQIKGWAPLLLDFPALYGGQPMLLCWLEGDLGLAWYHRPDAGFPGRRPLPFDA